MMKLKKKEKTGGKGLGLGLSSFVSVSDRASGLAEDQVQGRSVGDCRSVAVFSHRLCL